MTGKIYLENPYLKNLTSKVIEKEKIGNEYHIVLEKTIFIPRLSDDFIIDRGYINEIQVEDVFISDEKVVHVLKQDLVDKDVCMEINWNKRFDYMQQHTGEHIIRASLNKLCNAKVDETEINNEYSSLFINCDNLNKMDIDRIEKFANHMIYSNFKITSSDTEYEKVKRIAIDNMDTVTCENIHLSNTGEVGIIKIINFEKNEKGRIKLKFVCGSRALNDYNLKNNIINKLTHMLKIKDKDLITYIESIVDIED